MNAHTTKRRYAAPHGVRTRLRPLGAAHVRRRGEPSWKDQALAALATSDKSANPGAARPVTVAHQRPHYDWNWWQVAAQTAIAAGAITRLAISSKW